MAREPLDISNVNTSQKPQLPDFYANVPHAYIGCTLGAHCDVILKKTDTPVKAGKDKVSGAVVKN